MTHSCSRFNHLRPNTNQTIDKVHVSSSQPVTDPLHLRPRFQELPLDIYISLDLVLGDAFFDT